MFQVYQLVDLTLFVSPVFYIITKLKIKENEIYCWGYNHCGQLGLGNNENQYKPVKYYNDMFNKPCKFIFISCGWNHSFGLTENHLYSWGWDAEGQLGKEFYSQPFYYQRHNGNYTNIPQKLDMFDNQQIISISCGSRNYAVVINGNFYLFF